MARLTSTKKGWSTTLVVMAPLFLLFFSLQASSTSSTVVGDSSKQTSTRESANVESLKELFRDYTDNLSRLSAAYDLIGDADEAELINLFEQAIKRKYSKEDRAWKSELISLISTQLAPMNLDLTISLYESQPFDDARYMLYGVMHAWANEDFDAAVEFARKQDAQLHVIALRGIVDASLRERETTLMELGKEFGDVAYVERALASRQLKVDLADPDKSWARLINDRSINREENFDRLKHVANALIDKYGASEADNLLNSITSPALNFKLRKSLLSKMALVEPETAFSFALDTPNDRFGSMLATVIDTWATSDPQSALARVSGLEPSIVRDRLQHKVVAIWVQHDPESFVASVDSIPSELRDTARLSLVKYLSNDSIEDAVSVVVEITDPATQEEAALSLVDVWVDSNPEEAFAWILSSPETERYRKRLLNLFLEKLTERDADKAFELALSQPIGAQTEVGLEAIVIDKLSLSETERALQLLNRVRLGTTQSVAFKSVATGLIFDDRIEEAIELGKSLPEEHQVSYYKDFASLMSFTVPVGQVLEILPEIPVAKAQSDIAERMLMFGSVRNDKDSLSDEDVETLMEYVEPANQQRVQMFLRR